MAEQLHNANQDNALRELKNMMRGLLEQQIVRQKQIEGEKRGASTYETGYTNAIGVFGQRGAGKSTILVKLYQCWQKAEHFPEDLKSLYFLPPIDCSTLTQTKVPSAVVLLNIKRSLADLVKDDHKREALAERLDVLIGCSTRTDKDYRKLCLELSTSPEDYDFYQEKGIDERLALHQKLQQWLLDLRKLTEGKTLVILLDDFDLIAGRQVQAWINSLLDELHQVGLIFMLTADFYRLEHLSWNAKEGFDDKTGRALITKTFPPKNCLELPEWSLSEARTFKYSENETLEELIDLCLAKTPSLSKALILSLLPRLPRGIQNLYELLQIKTIGEAPENLALHFVGVLATCRNEPLLARLLKERNHRVWSNYLPLSEAVLSIEQWDTLIARARLRADPILAAPLLPLRPLLAKPETPNDKNSEVRLPSSAADEHAPLFHNAIYTLPLRDVAAVDANLWAELLVDIDMYGCVSHQAHFFTSWKPLQEKLINTQFDVNFPSWSLKDFFMDNEGSLHKSSLCWLTNPKGYTVTIGWSALFNNIRGITNPLSMDFLTKLVTNTYELKGEVPSQDALKLLPNRLWELLVFADALERCPWPFFSRFLNWLLATYIALAAALVASAYLYCLVSCNYVSDNSSEVNDGQPKLTQVQHAFFTMLKNRDPSLILQLSEEEVWKTLSDFFTDNEQLAARLISTQNLPQVTLQYLNSSVYRNAVELLNETISVYKNEQ